MVKILFMFLCAAIAVHAEISFKNEHIAVHVNACDTLEIVADYYFSNNDTIDATSMIFYPFPVDSVNYYPHYITVSRLKDGNPVPYVKKSEGVTWNLTVKGRSVDSLRVVYRQKVLKRKGCYILTTTKYWNKPLEQADFSVTVPANLTLDYWSFQFDSVGMQNDKMIYRARKTEFLPDADMMLEWSCK